MNRIIYLTLFLGSFLLFSKDAAAQKATIKGVVVDSAKTGDDAQLIGASIVAMRGSEMAAGTATTADVDPNTFEVSSKYELQLEAGNYTLKFSNLGYQDKIMQVSLSAGETKEINVSLIEGTLIDVVVVTGNKSGTSVAKSTVTIDVMGADLVKNSAATKVDDAVGKVPGVTVVDGQANIRGGAGYSYGAGSRVLILIDDMPFMQADAGLPNWRDIPVENIDQIEVLKGAASALYGSSALNGIINIRTAYAKSKPVTQLSFFGTAFGAPAMDSVDRAHNRTFSRQAWWLMDTITVNDLLIENKDTSYTVDSTFAPSFGRGPNGYRTPKEVGFQFAHRRKIGKLDLTLGGNLFWQDSPLGGQFERKVRVNTNLRYRVSDSLNFGVALNFNHGLSGSFFLWGNEGILLAPPGYQLQVDSLLFFSRAGAVTTSRITRFAVDPFLTAFDKKGNRHRVQMRVFYVDNQNANNQSNKSVLNYLEYQNQSTFHKAGGLQMVAGVVGQYTNVVAQLYGNAKYNVGNAAAYLQLEKGFVKKENSDDYKLNISFGARVELNVIQSPDSIRLSNSYPSDSLNPEPLSIQAKPVFRVGINYEVTPFTFIRASWGQGYRYPTVAERYILTKISALEIRPNPSLKSETGWSAELGIKQGFQITRKWKGFVDASFFWTEYKDMMEFTFGGGKLPAMPSTNIFFQSINTGDTRVLGTELTLMGTGDIGPMKLNVMAGYTFIDPRFKKFDTLQQLLSTDTTNILKYRSQHTAKLDFEFLFLKKMNYPLSFAVAFQYNSAMRAIDAAFQNLFLSQIGSAFNYDAFGIGWYRANVNRSQAFNLSARIGYRISIAGKKDEKGNAKEMMGIKLSLVGNNLLNQSYTVRPGLMATPVNFVARLDVDF